MKHRPLKQEHLKQVETLATKAKANGDAFYQQKPRTKSPEELIITATKHQAIYLIGQACSLIAHSHPEKSKQNQSKALELAQKYIDTEIHDINYIKDYLYQIKHTLKTRNFTCDHPRDFSNAILVGKSIYTQPLRKRIYMLIRKAIEVSSLPVREGLPGSEYEHMNVTQAWLEYICLLIKLLPEKPYIITGTPISQPIIIEEEEPDPEEPDPEEPDPEEPDPEEPDPEEPDPEEPDPEEPEGPAILQFVLINPVNNTEIMVLTDGQIIALDAYQATNGTDQFAIRADASAEGVESVSLELTGAISESRTENVAPYALFGDSQGDFQGQQLPIGQYTLTATPFSGAGGSGEAGNSLTISFEVMASGGSGNRGLVPVPEPVEGAEGEIPPDEANPETKQASKRNLWGFVKRLFNRKK